MVFNTHNRHINKSDCNKVIPMKITIAEATVEATTIFAASFSSLFIILAITKELGGAGETKAMKSIPSNGPLNPKWIPTRTAASGIIKLFIITDVTKGLILSDSNDRLKIAPMFINAKGVVKLDICESVLLTNTGSLIEK